MAWQVREHGRGATTSLEERIALLEEKVARLEMRGVPPVNFVAGPYTNKPGAPDAAAAMPHSTFVPVCVTGGKPAIGNCEGGAMAGNWL